MPIKTLPILDPVFSPLADAETIAPGVSDAPTGTTDKVKDRKPKGKQPTHQVKKTVLENPHPQGLARLFGQLVSAHDEPEEIVTIDDATKQLEDLKFTPPKELPAPVVAGQKIRFGLHDRISQTIAIENSGGKDARVSVFEYVYGNLDFEIAIDARGRLIIDPEKITLPSGIFARVSNSAISGTGQYQFYDLDVVILSNGWIRIHSKLTGQKVHYAVVKKDNSIRLRRYIGPTPDGLEIIHTIKASEPPVKSSTVAPENRIVEPSDRRFAPRPAMCITQVAPLPTPAEPAIVLRPSQPPQDRTHLKPAVPPLGDSPLFLSMDTFYGVLRHRAQFETLIASLQKFQAAETAATPTPTAAPTTKTSSVDEFVASLSPEDKSAIIDLLNNLPYDLFDGLFGGRRRRRKKTAYSPVPPTQWYRR